MNAIHKVQYELDRHLMFDIIYRNGLMGHALQLPPAPLNGTKEEQDRYVQQHWQCVEKAWQVKI